MVMPLCRQRWPPPPADSPARCPASMPSTSRCPAEPNLLDGQRLAVHPPRLCSLLSPEFVLARLIHRAFPQCNATLADATLFVSLVSLTRPLSVFDPPPVQPL